MNQFELWRLSKRVYEETLYQTQIATGGAQKTQILERYEKNMASARRVVLFGNLMMGFVLLYPTVLPLMALTQVFSLPVTQDNFHAVVFTNSLVFTIYMLLIFLFLFLFGFLTLVTFMKGAIFDFLRSLPLSPSDLQQLILYTLLRMNIIPLIVILFALPIGGFILSFSPFVFLVLFLNNLLNLTFIVFGLLILAYVLSQKVFKSSEKSPLVTIIMIVSVVLYVGTVISIAFFLSSLMTIFADLFTSNVIANTITPEINLALSLAFVPFSSNYFTSLVLISYPITPGPLLLASTAGTLVLLTITAIVVRKGISLIRKLAFGSVEDSYSSRVSPKDVAVKIKTNKPVISFIKNDIKILSRDFGNTSYFMLGIVMPLVFLLMSSISFQLAYEDQIRFFVPADFYIPMMLVLGLTSSFFYESLSSFEKELGGVLTALPFNNRDHFRSKQIIMVLAAQIPLLIILLLSMNNLTMQIIYSVIKMFFLNIISMTSALILHAFLFGKINNRYTLFMINLDKTLLKYIPLFGILYGSLVANIILIELVFAVLGMGFAWYLGIIFLVNVVFILILEVIVRRMFKADL
ncbi:MAG: hypothetical protein ACFFBD_00695 [Candidatus Hodarchaeota archaeon]